VAHTAPDAYTHAMSRLAVSFTILLGACGACSKSSDTPKSATGSAGSSKPLPKDSPPIGSDGAQTPEGAGDSFDMKLEQPAPVAPGAEAIARVTVTPAAGYHINQDFPTKLDLQPPAGVKVAKTTLEVGDAEKMDEHTLVFAVHATPSAAGSFTLPGKIKFAVCKGEEDCEPKRRDVSFTVAAQ
jgi:hypothetical protein